MEERNATRESSNTYSSRDDVARDDHDNGTWVIALTGAGEGYLGRVRSLDTSIALTDRAMQQVEFSVREVLRAKDVELFPVYEYREMVKEVPILRPGPDGRMKPMEDPAMPGYPALQPMRTPLVMPVGFTVEPHPVHVPGLCFGTVFRFFSQMDKRDAETYRGYAKDTRAQMTQMRLKASNFTAPSADDIARFSASKA